jgi:hypothetical protein
VYSALRTRRNKQHKPLHISRSAFRGATAPLWTIKTTTRTAKAVLPQTQAHLRLPLPLRADETTNETTKEMSNETSSQTAIEATKGTATGPEATPNRRRTARGAMIRARSPIGERARRTPHAATAATGAAGVAGVAGVATDSSGMGAGIAGIADADVAVAAEVPVAEAAIVDGRIARVVPGAAGVAGEPAARRARWTRRDNSRAANVSRSR